MVELENLQKRIGYIFSNQNLLRLALSHPSLNQKENNQRLEFLGDGVLGMVVAKMVYELFPNDSEGELARRQSSLVRSETLAELAKKIALGDALIMATSEDAGGGRSSCSNLEDALEALVGAIYLDGGLPAAEEFINKYWIEVAQSSKAAAKDAKTSLQEWAQGRGLPLPQYVLINKTGAAHAPVFTIEARVEGCYPASAQASSKRAAEQEAAALLLKSLAN